MTLDDVTLASAVDTHSKLITLLSCSVGPLAHMCLQFVHDPAWNRSLSSAIPGVYLHSIYDCRYESLKKRGLIGNYSGMESLVSTLSALPADAVARVCSFARVPVEYYLIFTDEAVTILYGIIHIILT